MNRIAGAGIVIAVGLYLLLALSFASHQAIWVDETTQLSGLSLSFDAQLAWLAGGDNPIPGVPPDRMPPLSYWLGSLWASAFGLTEGAMRAFGIAAVLCGVPAIFAASRRVAGEAGWVSAIVTSVYLLSPWTIVLAVEIRAYPLFLALSAWAVWAYVRCLCGDAGRAIWWLCLFCVLAAYAHFFGLVMGALLWVSLFLQRSKLQISLRQLGLTGLCAVLLCAGLVPFVLAAVKMGSGSALVIDPVETVKNAVRLVARLVLHQSHQASVTMWLPAVLAALLLLVLKVADAVRGDEVARGILWPIGLAALILPLLDLAIGRFDVLSVTYNTWLLPLVLMVFSRGARVRQGRALAAMGAAHHLGPAALVVLLLTHLVADKRLMQHAPAYAHGSGEWVFEAVADVGSTIVIHDGTGEWGFPYFVLFYLSNGALEQYLREPGQPDRRIVPGGFEPAFDVDERGDRRLYLRTEKTGTRELNLQIDGVLPCAMTGLPFAVVGEVRSNCAMERTTMIISDASL